MDNTQPSGTQEHPDTNQASSFLTQCIHPGEAARITLHADGTGPDVSAYYPFEQLAQLRSSLAQAVALHKPASVTAFPHPLKLPDEIQPGVFEAQQRPLGYEDISEWRWITLCLHTTAEARPASSDQGRETLYSDLRARCMAMSEQGISPPTVVDDGSVYWLMWPCSLDAAGERFIAMAQELFAARFRGLNAALADPARSLYGLEIPLPGTLRPGGQSGTDASETHRSVRLYTDRRGPDVPFEGLMADMLAQHTGGSTSSTKRVPLSMIHDQILADDCFIATLMPKLHSSAAQRYLDDLRTRFGLPDTAPVVCRYKQLWYIWTGTHYQCFDKEAATAEFTRWAATKQVLVRQNSEARFDPFEASNKWLGEFETHLRSLVPMPQRTGQWLDDGPHPVSARDVFNAANGFLDTRSGRLIDRDSRLFTVYSSEVEFLDDPPPPLRYERFLEEITGADTQTIDLLEEFAGLCLCTDQSFKKILQIEGPKDSGKSLFLSLIAHVLTPECATSMSPNDFCEKHALSDLVGKQFMSMPDAEQGAQKDLVVALERMKSISGGDPVSINPKNRTRYSTTLDTRFAIATNQTLSFRDASGAYAKRILIAETPVSFEGRADHTLRAQLHAELPGILGRWQRALLRLRDRGCFVQPERSTPLLEQLEGLSSPISDFARYALVFDDESQELTRNLYNAYTLYCRAVGEDVKSMNQFSKELHAALRHRGVTRQDKVGKEWTDGSRRARGFRGVRLHHAWKGRLEDDREHRRADVRDLLDVPLGEIETLEPGSGVRTCPVTVSHQNGSTRDTKNTLHGVENPDSCSSVTPVTPSLDIESDIEEDSTGEQDYEFKYPRHPRHAGHARQSGHHSGVETACTVDLSGIDMHPARRAFDLTGETCTQKKVDPDNTPDRGGGSCAA